VTVKTEEFGQMRARFAEVVELKTMFEREDFVVFGSGPRA
jgi:hypothetical protein